MEGNIYFLENLKRYKKISYMFGKIPIPPGIPFAFTLSTIIVASLLEIAFPTYFIVPILFIIVCFEYYSIVHIKSYILEKCIADEIYYQMDLIQHGVGEFEHDPLYVTDSDREDILEEVVHVVYCEGRNLFAYKIQNHYLFLISMVFLFYFIYSIMNYLFTIPPYLGLI